MIIRAELITPASDLIDRTVYNGMFTMHGTIMLFLWTFPSLVGLANYLVPIMIGAEDMAFPRLNALAFWLVPAVKAGKPNNWMIWALKTAQTKIGIRNKVIPGARIRKIVVTKLTAPKIEDTPETKMAKIHIN